MASVQTSTARVGMADEEIDVAAIAARFLAQAPPLQFPPVLDPVGGSRTDRDCVAMDDEGVE